MTGGHRAPPAPGRRRRIRLRTPEDLGDHIDSAVLYVVIGLIIVVAVVAVVSLIFVR